MATKSKKVLKGKLLDYRQRIEENVKYVDLKPYSHNIISMSFRAIAEGFGKAEANKAIRDFGLKALGWQEEKSVKPKSKR